MKKWFSSIATVLILLTGSSAARADDLMEAMENTLELRTFAQAARRSGLADELKKAGPFTVFAPSDTAFNNLGPDAKEELLADKSRLAEMVGYHVIKDKILIAEVSPGPAQTMEGTPVSLKSDNGLVSVNGASVIQSDIEAGNGVIHIIDTVLKP